MRLLVPERHALARAAALGVDEELRVRGVGLPARDVLRTDPGVDVALAHPDPELPARDLLEPEPEEHVGEEEDLGVLGDRLDDALRVPGRAAVVALRLHLGRRVHVGDDDRPGILRLPRAKLIGRDRRGEGAARVEVGDEHGLLRAEDRGRLGHEVDAAEDDRVGVRRSGLA